MLKKNNLLIAIIIMLTSLIVSCDTYVEGSIYSVTFELRNKDNIESNIIKVTHVNRVYNNVNEEVEFLVNVACSLRNDSINENAILAIRFSNNDGEVSFGFTDNEKRKKGRKDCYLVKDLASEHEAKNNGTSKFYIVVNDPELPGYDELYETKIISCNELTGLKKYQLGKKAE